MLPSTKIRFIKLIASIPLAMLFLLAIFVITVYADDDNIKSAQSINDLNFSLNSITLSSNDMPSGSVELSSLEITGQTTDFHLLTSEFMERLNTFTMPVEEGEVSTQNVLVDFVTGRAYTAVSSENTIVVGNYNYIYADVNAAVDVANRIKATIENDGIETIPQYTSDSQIAIKLLGDESDTIYWYISTKDNVLITLFANGILGDETFQVFESSIAKILEKQIATVNSRIYLPIFQSNSSGDAENVQSAAVAYRGPAYQVGVAFTTSGGWVPHYGAWFYGTNGRSQYFICWYQPSGYSSWNWWGPGARVLLLEKTWLFSTGGNGWNPGCHYAVTD